MMIILMAGGSYFDDATTTMMTPDSSSYSHNNNYPSLVGHGNINNNNYHTHTDNNNNGKHYQTIIDYTIGRTLNSSQGNRHKINTLIDLVVRIEEWIKYDFPELRDNIIHGVIIPLLNVLILLFIIAIIVRVVKNIFFPPSSPQLHLYALKLLPQSTHLMSNDSDNNKATRENLMVPKISNQKLVIQQKTSTTKQKKKLRSLRSSLGAVVPSQLQTMVRYIRCVFSSPVGWCTIGEGEDPEMCAVKLLQQASNAGYNPASISLAAYYVYRCTKPTIIRYNQGNDNSIQCAKNILHSITGTWSSDNVKNIIPVATATTSRSDTAPNHSNCNESNHKINADTSIVPDEIQFAINSILYDIRAIESGQMDMVQTILREDEYLSILYAQQWMKDVTYQRILRSKQLPKYRHTVVHATPSLKNGQEQNMLIINTSLTRNTRMNNNSDNRIKLQQKKSD